MIIKFKLHVWRQLVQNSTAEGRPYNYIFNKNISLIILNFTTNSSILANNP